MKSRYHHLKERIIILRKSGKTYAEICKIIGIKISKGTLSNWCGSISLSPEQRRRVERLIKKGAQKGQAVASIVNQIKRKEYLKSLEKKNLYLLKKLNNKDILKIALSMLYLGEGGKWSSHRGLFLGSSDPDIIKLYLKLLKSCYNIDKNKLRCRVSYRADQNINKLQKFWSKMTKIPLYNFYKTKPDPRTIGKRTLKKDYKGVCVISGGGTEIQLELEIIAKLISKGPWRNGSATRWHLEG